MRNKKFNITIKFLFSVALLLILFLISVKAGSINVSYKEIIKGIFQYKSKSASVVYDLRFPRVFISIMAGAGIGVSGVLLQAVMKNPLTDPGIIGISASSSFITTLIALIIPGLYFFLPVFSIIGGLLGFFIIYTLSWDKGVKPVRLILVGIALNMTFIGLLSVLESISSGGVKVVSAGNISQSTWSDVKILFVYTVLFLLAAMFLYRKCNYLLLEDKTARSLGINVDKDRFIVATVAVILSSVATSIVGIVSFLGLCVPHISRIIIGSNHKLLIPYSAILGSIIFLLSDTVGRVLFYPYEIQASVIMSIIGGPFFIFLLKRGGREYGN